MRRIGWPRLRVVLTSGLGLLLSLSGCKESTGPGSTPTQLAFVVQPTSATAGVALSPTVQVTVQDAQGNTVTSATTSVTLAIGTNPGGGALSGTATVAAVNGVATFSNLSLDKVGTGYTLTAAATRLTGATSAAFDVTFGAAARLAVTVQPTNAVVGTAITPAVAVTVQDAQGNTVTSATTSVTLAIGTNPGGGTLSGATTVAAVSGVATFSNLSIDKAGAGYTLTAAATSLTSATSSAFSVTAKLAFIVQPTNATAATAISPAVAVAIQDAQGNTVASATTSVTIAIGTNPGGGTLSGTVTVAAVSGVATFSNLSFDKAGTGYTLSAAATGVTGATSAAFNVTAGAAAKLAFTVQPTNATAAAAISPVVTVVVRDASGNTVTSATTSVTLAIGTNPGGGTLSGTATVGAVSGVATFSNLSIDKAGIGYTLTAMATSLTGATSTAFNVTFGAAAKLAVTVQPTNTVAGTAITPPVAVTVQDVQGNMVTSATTGVTLAIGTNAGGGTLLGTATVAADGGVATFLNLSIDKAGAGYALTAAATGLTGATSVLFGVLSPVPFAAASAGNDFTCALTTAGAAYCWGPNPYGQLGTGTAYGSSVPQAVRGNLQFSVISAGGDQYEADFSCGLTVSGLAYCWGHNGDGELGDGTTTDSPTPVAVTGGLTFVAVSAGYYHSCGLTAAGAAFCWGLNNFGQLGDGTLTSRLSPVAVAGGRTFTSLSAGGYQTCGVTQAGAAYCWGGNQSGELGDGTTATRAVPTPVAGGGTFIAISAGPYFSCGIVSGGAAYCWGDNSFGQLGDGSTASHATPGRVVGSYYFKALAAEFMHTCAVEASGAAYCWGDNQSGEIGDGSTTSRSAPVPIAGGLTFVSVTGGGYLFSNPYYYSVGFGHSCGVTTGGVTYCWGDNSLGQLGVGSYVQSNIPVKVAGQP